MEEENDASHVHFQGSFSHSELDAIERVVNARLFQAINNPAFLDKLLVALAKRQEEL